MDWFLIGTILPSFTLAWAGGWVLRRKAFAWGLVDYPGGHKGHGRPMPLGGGLAIGLGIVGPIVGGGLGVALVHAGWLDPAALPELARTHMAGLIHQSGKLGVLLAAAIVMMLLGLADDLGGIPWPFRLAVQTAVALFMVAAGWRLTLFVSAPLLTALLSVVWIVGLTNSFNMLDNMDGLSAGVAAIAALALAGVMLLAPDPQSHLPQLFVGGFFLLQFGALSGFLCHNHPPARLFMGDAGSYLIGFCLATTTIAGTFAGGSLPRYAILAPLCALAVPMYDTASVILIRIRHRRSPFHGDRSHLSHRLVRMGLSKAQAVWTIYLVTVATGLAALLLHQVDAVGAALIVILVACLLAIVAILESASYLRSSTEGPAGDGRGSGDKL